MCWGIIIYYISDLKLHDMKAELEKIQRDREGLLSSIKTEYEQFQVKRALLNQPLLILIFSI